jgi:hypothetical protein
MLTDGLIMLYHCITIWHYIDVLLSFGTTYIRCVVCVADVHSTSRFVALKVFNPLGASWFGGYCVLTLDGVLRFLTRYIPVGVVAVFHSVLFMYL